MGGRSGGGGRTSRSRAGGSRSATVAQSRENLQGAQQQLSSIDEQISNLQSEGSPITRAIRQESRRLSENDLQNLNVGDTVFLDGAGVTGLYEVTNRSRGVPTLNWMGAEGSSEVRMTASERASWANSRSSSRAYRATRQEATDVTRLNNQFVQLNNQRDQVAKNALRREVAIRRNTPAQQARFTTSREFRSVAQNLGLTPNQALEIRQELGGSRNTFSGS